jgi:hypothetical protein
MIGGGVGGIGRVGGGARRAATPPAPPPVFDFTLSGTTATTVWNGTAVFGDLVPVGISAAEVYFELVNEDAGLAVVNG